MTRAELFAAVIRGDRPEPRMWTAFDTEDLLAAAHHHGVTSLLASRLVGDEGVPAAVRARLHEHVRAHAALDLEREMALAHALDRLAAAGLPAVVFKGAHLAYTCYERPDLRPRLDSDLLIAAGASSRARAHEALLAAGYETAAHAGGDLVMTQRTYRLRRHGRVVHAIDLHWRIANPQAFARVLTYDELAASARPIPALGPNARGPSPVHAMLIACTHRIAHHGDADCLIWLYDIDRLARRLSAGEWLAFVAISRERGVASACAASLSRAIASFRSPIPVAIAAELAIEGGETRDAASAFLGDRPHGLSAAIADWRALDSWADRLRLLREHALPPRAYMRDVYAPASRAPLAWLYARRAATGVRRWLIG
jgi:hypothetical protein